MAIASTPDRAVFSYENGFTATGSFTGDCQAAGYLPRPGTSGELFFPASQARLVVLSSWRNETIFFGDGPIPASFNTKVAQHVSDTPLGAGTFGLRWNSTSHWYLSHAIDNEAREMHASLRGTMWGSDAPLKALIAGPERYYEPTPIGPLEIQPAIPGPARFVDTDQDHFSILGDGTILADNVTFLTPTSSFELAPYRQEYWVNETPVSAEWHVLFTHAHLVLNGVRLDLTAEAGHLACRTLDWQGTGVVTYRAATGEVVRGSDGKSFARRELTVDGAFRSTDVPSKKQMEWGETVVVGAEKTGTFSAIGLDFAPVASVPGRFHLDPKVPAAAAILAAGLMVLAKFWSSLQGFFTRLTKAPALQHDKRSLINTLACERPGITLKELVAGTGDDRGTIRHHVRMMEKVGLLRSQRWRGEVHVFPMGVDQREALRRYVLDRDERVRYLVGMLATGPVQMLSVRHAIAKQFSLDVSTAWHVIRRAQDAGLVSSDRAEGGVFVRALH